MKIKFPKFVTAIIIIAILLAIGWLIPTTQVLAEGELFDQALTFQSNLFNKILFGGTIGLLLIYGAFFLWKGNNKYGDNIGFQGDGSSSAIAKLWHEYDALQRTIISIMGLGLVFLTSTFLDFGTFTGLRFLPQQFTPVKSIIFSTLMIPVSENMMASFVIGLTVLILSVIAIKYDLKVSDYRLYTLIAVPVVLGGLAILWHSTAYAGSDYALTVVFFFWAVGGFLSIYLEDAIPFLIAHMFNNFFIDFTRLFTSDTALFTVAFFIFGVPALVWIIFYQFKFKGSKA